MNLVWDVIFFPSHLSTLAPVEAGKHKPRTAQSDTQSVCRRKTQRVPNCRFSCCDSADFKKRHGLCVQTGDSLNPLGCSAPFG